MFPERSHRARGHLLTYGGDSWLRRWLRGGSAPESVALSLPLPPNSVSGHWDRKRDSYASRRTATGADAEALSPHFPESVFLRRKVHV